MNCDGCINLIENQCRLGKHQVLNTLYMDDGSIISLDDCIFKNTQYDVDFKTSHQLAMSNIAIASYFFLDETNEDKLWDLLTKEEQYMEGSLIAEFNVLMEKPLFDPLYLQKIAIRLNEINFARNKRLWNLAIPPTKEAETEPSVGVPKYILNTCKMPYYMILESESDFAMAHTFKYKCFSGPIPKRFGKITSVKYIRKQLEKLDKDAEIQAQYSI